MTSRDLDLAKKGGPYRVAETIALLILIATLALIAYAKEEAPVADTSAGDAPAEDTAADEAPADDGDCSPNCEYTDMVVEGQQLRTK
jgi:hypothetical protein